MNCSLGKINKIYLGNKQKRKENMTLTFVKKYKFNSEFNFFDDISLLSRCQDPQSDNGLKLLLIKWSDDNFMDANVTTTKTNRQKQNKTNKTTIT